MNKLKRFFLCFVCFLLSLLLTACSGDDTYSKITDFTPHTFVYSDGIADYGYYNIGNCKKLVGDVYSLVIFLDDDESGWNEEARSIFYSMRFEPSISFITEKAKTHGVKLNLKYGQYSTKQDTSKKPHYNGKVENSAEKAINNLDIFSQTAKTLGFPNKEVMHAYLQNYTGVEQIAYFIVLNKPGRAYAVCDTTYDGADSIEFVVAFSSDEYANRAIGSSVIHEMLHLFGATDLYDSTGHYKKRERLCKKLYPDDIMRKSSINPDSLSIGRLTECLIGWSDYFPSECDCPEWWETDYEETHRPHYNSSEEASS